MRSHVFYRYPAIILVMLLAFALRAYNLTSESLWIDEGYSIALADHNLIDIIRGTIADQHPPLYYLLLHAWRALGDSIYQVRYLSVLFGVLGVSAAAALARVLFGKPTGMLVMLWCAVAPMHIWYSQEARMYILLTLLMTLSFLYFWRLPGHKTAWLGYAVFTVLSLYTHNYAVFVVIVQNLLVVAWIVLKLQPVRFLRRWVVAQAVVVGAYAGWVPIVFYQAQHHQMSWLASPSLATLRDTLNWLLLGQSIVKPRGIVWFLLLGLLGVLVFLTPRRLNRGVTVVLAWLLLPLGLTFIVSQRYPIFQAKQFLLVLPALLGAGAVALRNLKGLVRLAMVGVLFTFNLHSLLLDSVTLTKHEWREVAAYVASQMTDGDILYLNPAAGKLVLEEYLPDAVPYSGYPPNYDVVRGGWEGVLVDEATPERVLGPIVADYSRVWLIEFSPGFWDPGGRLAEWLADHADLVDARQFRGITVRLFAVHT